MKRFFYGIMAAGLLIASGCGGSKDAKSDASTEMSAEELARAEEEAVKELAKIIAEEAADMPVAEMSDEYDAFDYESLSDAEKAQLVAWEQEAESWAREQMALEEDALQTADADAHVSFDAADADSPALATAQADSTDAATAA